MLLLVLAVHAQQPELPQQFHAVQGVAVNPLAPKVVPAKNFTRERWFDATANKELTIATFEDGSLEGQFIDVGADRQCNFEAADAAMNISCTCQPIPFPQPLVNAPQGVMVGLTERAAAWAAGRNVTCETWEQSAKVPGSMVKPTPVTETCRRFVEHAAPHRDVGGECTVCAATQAACTSPSATWLTRSPMLRYAVGAPNPATLAAPPACS